jgi:2-C-methyl-D-erythritol 4-phosphate cytidylyltransferase/2-C-methyl-D-erythritol 2,4-cyclodiphosphate synthase
MIYAIVPAAGSGLRMQGSGKVSKQFLNINGQSILNTTLKALWTTGLIDGLVVVMPENAGRSEWSSLKELPFFHKITVVIGGPTRSQSVANGLEAVSSEAEYVLVHDGVRPLVSKALVERVIKGAYRTGAAICGIPVADTIKRVSDDGTVIETVAREGLYTVQTPQVFKKELLVLAHSQEGSQNKSNTDDASLLEALGYKVTVVKGDPYNIKITYPEDLTLARLLLKQREAESMRVGMGYDVHKLVAGRDLIIGGVKIPHELGLLGYSDADVLIHAVMDALLGAAALGDIGKLFPDDNPAYLNASSMDLLAKVGDLLKDHGYSPQQIDAVIMAERPKLADYIKSMRQNIAHALQIDMSDVSVKATTCEGLGFVGQQQGIEAQAVAVIRCSS